VLVVHRAERADHLVGALGDLLLAPLADVMAAEVISVPTRGVERWLSQRLSVRLGTRKTGGDGVCANVEFPFPGSLVDTATAAACGVDPERDPWPPERSVWPLLKIVDDNLGEPFLAPLRRHLEALAGGEGKRLRRYPAVRRLADLFDRYAINRPDLLERWAAGEAGWGAGEDDDEAWQAELWRRLRTHVGVPGPAERYREAATRLAKDGGLVELPARISVFGLTRLPASYLLVLRALAVERDIHLFLLHPSPALWDKVAGIRPAPPASLLRSEDATAGLVANPLLRSWGRDSREMQLVLAAQGIESDDHGGVEAAPATLLGRIQCDIRADRRPGTDAPETRPLLNEHDNSLQVHACHGRQRQVEVMRDAILHLLASDETLEPRDVVIMCPDIETVAPLVTAAFGRAQDQGAGPEEGADPPRIRVRLADRSIRQTNPLLAVAARLLALAAGRAAASEILDLAAMEPVSRRFGFDDDDLAQFVRWVADSGIRWAIDGAGRARWHLEAQEANTWRSGLDRLLLGVAMSEDGMPLFGDVLPFDDVSISKVDLVGRITEMISRLGGALDELDGEQTLERWTAALADATDNLAVSSAREHWQLDELRALLADVAEESASEDEAPLLDLAEVTDLLEERLKGRPTRANFRTGDLTVCTLVPMRSVPHRVVGLLGLDDGVFPPQRPRDGDNLLLSAPRVGERDPRSEDRQLLLDAVMAAQQHLIITYEGRDLRTNQLRPPSVPVAELLDAVDRTVHTGDADMTPRQRVIVEHPLKSFDPRNFEPGALGTPEPFGFDPLSLQGARALAASRQEPAPFLTGALPPLEGSVLSLDALVGFVEHPVRAFLRDRLALYPGGDADVVKDDIPIDLDALESWQVGDRLLAARLRGLSIELVSHAERARGILPPGALAQAELDRVEPSVEALVGAYDALACAGEPARSLPVHVELADGRLVTGAVSGVHGDTMVSVGYSRLGARQRIAAWTRFLALAASMPGRTVIGISVGRGQPRSNGSPRIMVAELDALDPDPAVAALRARKLLEVLVDLYDRGMREPLPLYCQTSAAWATAAATAEDPVAAAAGKWKTAYEAKVDGEDRDRYHEVVVGRDAPFESLLHEASGADESGAGWEGGEPSRLGRLARRLWDPVLGHERVATR
jgi:exodeoxyribonuclease V gamma subunit